jgi:hypothetical protein
VTRPKCLQTLFDSVGKLLSYAGLNFRKKLCFRYFAQVHVDLLICQHDKQCSCSNAMANIQTMFHGTDCRTDGDTRRVELGTKITKLTNLRPPFSATCGDSRVVAVLIVC